MRELSLNVMDIVQNSVRAGASLITVQVAESKKHDTGAQRLAHVAEAERTGVHVVVEQQRNLLVAGVSGQMQRTSRLT